MIEKRNGESRRVLAVVAGCRICGARMSLQIAKGGVTSLMLMRVV